MVLNEGWKRRMALNENHAKVAQLVEHDLAKVGVASSNLVFRSKCLRKKAFILKGYSPAQMVELVDTQDLKSCDLKSRAGSIPALSTQKQQKSRSESDRLFCWVQ